MYVQERQGSKIHEVTAEGGRNRRKKERLLLGEVDVGGWGRKEQKEEDGGDRNERICSVEHNTKFR